MQCVNLAKIAEQTFLSFSTTYIPECDFSAVLNVLSEKGNNFASEKIFRQS